MSERVNGGMTQYSMRRFHIYSIQCAVHYGPDFALVGSFAMVLLLQDRGATTIASYGGVVGFGDFNIGDRLGWFRRRQRRQDFLHLSDLAPFVHRHDLTPLAR